MKPLKTITVLDLSRVLAGPICAQTLGDLGADVIKIEPTGAGDESRSWPPAFEGTATAYLAANRNKKSIAINLKEPAGQKILHELVATADVVIESAATGVSERLGADYQTLSAINPRLVYCTVSGFGRSGPMRDKRGYDLMLQAYSGMMSLVGDEDSGAIRIPFSPIDQTTGYHAALGVMAALMEREQTGRGALVEVSLLETAVSLVGYMMQAQLADPNLPVRMGTKHPGIAPYQDFRAADKAVLIGIANDKLWRAFCTLYGIEHLADDARFATNRDRVRNRDEVVAVVQDIVGNIAAEALLEQLDQAGVPCAPINTLADIPGDPQVCYTKLVQPLTVNGKPSEMQGVVLPITFNGEERDLGTPPPGLGEHSDAVLGRLGYSAEQIAALEADGAIGR